MSEGLCPQGAPCPAADRRQEPASQERAALPRREARGLHHAPATLTTTDASGRQSSPSELEGKSRPRGFQRWKDRPRQPQARPWTRDTAAGLYSTCSEARPPEPGAEGVTMHLRPHVTYGHNLLSKSKFQRCLLVGSPFLHHACRHTSMA